MKTLAAVLIIAFALTSCTKEMEFHLPKKYTTGLKNKIEIHLYYQRYLLNRVETFKGQTFGDDWSTTTFFEAPSVADDGVYTIYDIPETEGPTVGEFKINMHRSAAMRDPSKVGTADSLDLIGDGYWTLISSSGTYSYLTKAAGTMKYYQTYDDPYEGIPATEYDLIGLSN